MLTDSFNRRFTYLRLSITEACNYRCNYCLPDGYCPSGSDAPLSLPEISAAAKAFALCGTRKIRITGGEPSLRKDLPDIIRSCKTTTGIETVALTSNGYRLHKDIDNYIDAGLDALNISIDSLRPETFRLITGHDKLTQTLDSIDTALAKGLRKIKINAVLMEEFNRQDLNSFFDWIKNTPITLRFIELMQTGDNAAFYRAQRVSGKSIQQQLQASGWLPIFRGRDAGPAMEYSHPSYAGKIGLIMPYSKDFCESCNRLRLSSAGKLHLCLFADEKTDIRSHLLNESPQTVAERLHELVLGKKKSHYLDRQHTGSTKHLAMLGG